MRLRARWVLPVSSPPIRDGEVVVEDGRITAVRPFAGGESRDLGNSILMPGLVNVHTHLEYTVMRGLLEDLPFFTWIRELTARKAALEEAHWVASSTVGAAEAVAGGVTTVADCTDSGAALIGAKRLGLRGVIYQEVFSLDESEPVDGIVQALDVKVRALRWAAGQAPGRIRVGISPHAPYTVRPAALRALAAYAEREQMPVCIHAAESQAEAEILRNGRGVIGQMFEARGIGWLKPPPGKSAVAHLEEQGVLSSRTLLVHGVQLSAADRAAIRRSGAAWAHCPKSNAKLGNGIAPLGLMRGCYEDGCARVGLGSDSVASNNTMDLFEEMRFAVLAQRARSHRIEAMTARDAVELATIGGARALGLDTAVGTLEPGKQADLIAVSTEHVALQPCFDPNSALVYCASARDVRMTMVGGDIVYEDDRCAYRELAEARQTLQEAAERMCAWTPPA